LRPTTINVT